MPHDPDDDPITNISHLVGKTIVHASAVVGGDLVTLVTDCGHVYQMLHDQDCCENVLVEDITGDLADLIGSPILIAEQRTNSEDPPEHADSWTWTFYELGTLTGRVTFRWLGESNGYYGEDVDVRVSVHTPDDQVAWTIAGDYAEAKSLGIDDRYRAYFERFGGAVVSDIPPAAWS